MEDQILQWVDKGIWLVITGLASFAVQALRSMNHSISDLNHKVAVMIERMTNQEKRIDTLEDIVITPRGKRP